MKTIIITGPSGSGKTYLSTKLSKLLGNSIVLQTDSFYRDNLLIRFLSIFIYDLYDRPLSIKKNKIMKTIKSIHNKDKLISIYKYDFKRRYSSHSTKSICYKGDKQFLILEGIFAHRLDIKYKETINIVCEEQKEICFKRRLMRDQLERGRKIKDVKRKFNMSWYLFYKNIKDYIYKYKVLSINPADEIAYNKLASNLQNITNKNNQRE